MVEVKETKQIEEIISGPTKEPDPDATPYDDCITYEKEKKKMKKNNHSQDAQGCNSATSSPDIKLKK